MAILYSSQSLSRLSKLSSLGLALIVAMLLAIAFQISERRRLADGV